ncbi:MAG: hypothetical protein WA628_23050 [Terriglobales bacterium]
MNARLLDILLTELENSRYRFGGAEGTRVAKALVKAASAQYDDVPSLIRFHEALLVLRAFPPNAAVLRRSEQLLRTLWRRVERLRKSGADMDDFDPLEVSGLAGTTMQDALSFDLARWLVTRMPGKVEIAWDDFDDERALGAVWPRLMPLLKEDTLAEANIPWRKWLEAAQGSRTKSPAWLIERFTALPLSDVEQARLYDSLRMPIRWRLENSRISRTRNARPVRRVFYHDHPLVARKDVSLAQELARRPPELTRLSRAQGESVMDLIREVMLVRYRELYGTTLGDPRSVVRADVGRGVSICLWNLPAARRLPLRAYVAGLTLKNGVPINYIEGIGLFEWIEVGFNTFYTFRGGEVAWIFAQVLRCLCRLTGATCISMYPYQLGHNNQEAIESGAFWFYRKLGFRPGRPDLLRLVEREEARIADNPKYKTSARTLRRLAEGHAFYELPGSEIGAWDQFSTRNLGLRVNRRMAVQFGGNVERFKKTAATRLHRILGEAVPGKSGLPHSNAFLDFAMSAVLIPDLASWSAAEKKGLLQIIRAKSGSDEMRYLHLLQRHGRLRDALLKLGSKF